MPLFITLTHFLIVAIWTRSLVVPLTAICLQPEANIYLFTQFRLQLADAAREDSIEMASNYS